MLYSIATGITCKGCLALWWCIVWNLHAVFISLTGTRHWTAVLRVQLFRWRLLSLVANLLPVSCPASTYCCYSCSPDTESENTHSQWLEGSGSHNLLHVICDDNNADSHILTIKLHQRQRFNIWFFPDALYFGHFDCCFLTKGELLFIVVDSLVLEMLINFCL